MKKSILGFLTIFSLLMATNSNAQSKDKVAAEKLVHLYFEALNTGDTNKTISLFAQKGVLLAQGAPTASGSEQIAGTFKYVFDNFSYALEVSIDDIIVQDNYATVSSSSKGSFTIKVKNEKVTTDYRETFVLVKEEDAWKIARYMYNETK